ncbi:MAG: dTMP kinase, partial [Chloroflexota bacterium]
MKGTFITLEGPEGAGKTVLAKRLAEAVERQGRIVRSTREPGGTQLGERLRAILLEHGAEGSAPVVVRADALLFNAARAQLVAEVIRPALDRGEVVICARFTDSTLAYQGYGAGLPLDELRPRRVEEQRIRSRPDPQVSPPQQDVAHPLAEPSATGLPRQPHP